MTAAPVSTPLEKEVDPRLTWLLRAAGREWGALGVALAAAVLTKPHAVTAALNPGRVTVDETDLRFLLTGMRELPVTSLSPDHSAAWGRLARQIGGVL